MKNEQIVGQIRRSRRSLVFTRNRMVPHALFSAVVVKVPLLRAANVFLVGPLVRARSLCSLFLFYAFCTVIFWLTLRVAWLRV